MAGDSTNGKKICLGVCFNPRPRMAGDKYSWRISSPPGVSIRARAWRAMHTRRYQFQEQPKFQSAPAHGGRYDPTAFTEEQYNVSIRARAWRAILHYSRRDYCWHRFNPRPRMAGDCVYLLLFWLSLQFQSAPAHGGRSAKRPTRYFCHRVSIRARAWRAIEPPLRSPQGGCVSIRARAWRAMAVIVCVTPCVMFQSAPAHGGRSRIFVRDNGSGKFQSAPAHGGRYTVKSSYLGVNGFQSAPAHGGRFDRSTSEVLTTSVSIRARAWRAISPSQEARKPIAGFNPRPRMAGDSEKLEKLSASFAFQSAPAHGGRYSDRAYARLRHSFNPRPRMAGDHPARAQAVAPNQFQSAPAHGGRYA